MEKNNKRTFLLLFSIFVATIGLYLLVTNSISLSNAIKALSKSAPYSGKNVAEDYKRILVYEVLGSLPLILMFFCVAVGVSTESDTEKLVYICVANASIHFLFQIVVSGVTLSVLNYQNLNTYKEQFYAIAILLSLALFFIFVNRFLSRSCNQQGALLVAGLMCMGASISYLTILNEEGISIEGLLMAFISFGFITTGAIPNEPHSYYSTPRQLKIDEQKDDQNISDPRKTDSKEFEENVKCFNELKYLHDNQLISDEDYKEKVREIIGKL